MTFIFDIQDEEMDMSFESYLEDNIHAITSCIDALSDEANLYWRFKDSASRNPDIAQYYRHFKEENGRVPTMRELQKRFPDEVCNCLHLLVYCLGLIAYPPCYSKALDLHVTFKNRSLITDIFDLPCITY